MTDSKPIDPALLVPGAKVLIEGTVERILSDGSAVLLGPEGYLAQLTLGELSAIVSVTPPPVDWSKVIGKQVLTNLRSIGRLVAVDDEDGWVRFHDGSSYLARLSDLTPLPDEPSDKRMSTALGHDLYETGDADAPEQIKDRNGEVVLGLCRRCGKGEIELSEPCEPSAGEADTTMMRNAVTWAEEAKRIDMQDAHPRPHAEGAADMSERREFEMTQADLDTLLAAMKPVPYMVVGGCTPISQQENANNAWERLGDKLGFDHMTVRPCGKGDRFFTAMPKEPTHD